MPHSDGKLRYVRGSNESRRPLVSLGRATVGQSMKSDQWCVGFPTREGLADE